MREKARNRIAIIAVLCLAALFLLLSRLVKTGPSPNLVLIVIDTLRADHLSCYGYDRIHTPAIDSLARNGVLIESANSHVPITLPSLCTIMSSTLPPENRVHVNEESYLDESFTTLAEILRGEGYQTGGVVAAVVLDSITGIAQGFRYYKDDFPEFDCYLPVVRKLKSQYDHAQRRAEDVTNEALNLLSTMMTDEPFFLFVHYFDPHTPKDPPPPYSTIDPNLPIESPEQQIRLYDGEIAYTDEQIGRLVNGLDRLGILENTLIVLTADHGEGLNEHGEKTHAFFVYDQTIHIPLIFTMPGRIPRNLACSAVAGHIDVAPTILDILGIEWRGKYGFQGVSLYPFEGSNGSDFSYFECVSPFVMYGWSGLRGVRTPEWKFIDAPVRELYDLVQDPGERRNLAEQRSDVADSMQLEMEEFIAMIRPRVGEGDDPARSGEGKRPIDPAFQEKLRALGYIGVAGDPATDYDEMFDRSLADPKDKISDFRISMWSNHYTRLGIVMIEKDSLQSAVDFLRNSIEMDRGNIPAYYYLGVAYTRSGDYKRGREAFGDALELNPSYVQASLALVDLELLRGDSVAARLELEGVLSRGIETRKEVIRASRLWGRLGEGDRSVGLLEGILDGDPGDVPVRLYVGEHYLLAGDFARAFPYLEPLEQEMERGDSLAARLYYGLGRCYYHGGELARALEMFRRVVSLDSTVAEGYSQLGIVYDDLGEYEQAVENYRRALELDPGMVEMHSNLGVSYYKMGRYEESRDSFEAYLPHVTDAEELERVRAFIEHIEGL